jgi:hypothetical protein
MARRSPPRKVTYFEPVPPRLARNTIVESTFEVGRRFRCTMRVDCRRLDPGAVIRPEPGEWHPRTPERPDEEELAEWRAGRDAGLSARRTDNRRGVRGRQRMKRAFAPYRLRRRFVHTEHNMINCRLGSPQAAFRPNPRQPCRRTRSIMPTATP